MSVDDIVSFHSSHPSIVNINQMGIEDNSRFVFKQVTRKEVLCKLRSIKVGKSTGFDKISPKTVKLCADELCDPFTSIVNNALETNTFPIDMKKAEICPVFKKKDHMSKENYRPVNIIPTFAKIFESIIADQVGTYMNNHLSRMLGAYKKGHGCAQLLTLAVDSWKWCLDDGLAVGILLMDLSKAFDAIPHDLLISKLHSYGFSKGACQMLLSYLTHRQQRVKLKDVRSEWKITNRGIPQGSCLGPLIFNIFLNDIFMDIRNCKLFNYADDNTLSASHYDISIVIDKLLKDTTLAIEWFQNNFMKVNPEKFQIMFMQPKGKSSLLPETVDVVNHTINVSDKVVLLGIQIDNKLNFDSHVKSLCVKANCQLKVLMRFKKILGDKEKVRLFNTFILSCFNFCPTVWTFCSVKSVRKMERIQERALRFLTNDVNSTYSDLLRKSSRSTMFLSRLKAIAIEVYKCVNDINPVFLNEMFHMKNIPHNLRDSSKLVLPKFKTTSYGKQTLSYYGVHLWNMLPHQYKTVINVKEFRKLLSTWDGPKCHCNLCHITW